MANTQLPNLEELSSVADGDLFYTVDVSDTTDGSDGTSKKISRTNIIGSSVVTLTGTQTLTNKTLTSPASNTPTITSPKINVTSDAEGDVYYRNSAGNFTRLAPGNSGEFLQTQGASNPPQWSSSAGSGAYDLNGGKLTFDANGNTSMTADTDDQIDIEISGADDFQFTANTFTALSGSAIATDTINEVTGANGVDIDSIKLKDGNLITTGAADDITITPGANKVIKIAMHRRSLGTTTQANSQVIVAGWNYDTGDSNIGISQSENYGVTFDSFPIVVASIAGVKTDAGAPTTPADLTGNFGTEGNIWAICTSDVGTGGFTAHQRFEAGDAFTSGDFYGYMFIAIGAIA